MPPVWLCLPLLVLSCLANVSIHKFIIFSHTGCHMWSVEKMSFLAVTTLPCLGKVLLIFFVDKISKIRDGLETKRRDVVNRDSGKSRIYWREIEGFDCFTESGIHQNIWARDEGIFCLSVRNSGSRSQTGKLSVVSVVSPVKANYRVT